MSDDDLSGLTNFFVLNASDMEDVPDTHMIQLEKVQAVLNEVRAGAPDIALGLLGDVIDEYDPEKTCALQISLNEDMSKFCVNMLALAAMHIQDGEAGPDLWRQLADDLDNISAEVSSGLSVGEVSAVQAMYEDTTPAMKTTLPAGMSGVVTRYTAMLKDDLSARLKERASTPEHNVVPMFE